jgi:outer membrane protein TolC
VTIRMGRVIAALVAVSGSSPLDAQTVLLSRDQVIERALARSTEVARLRQTAVAGTRLAGATQYPANPVVSVELEGTPGPWSGQEYSRRVALEQEIDLRGERGARRGVSVASSRVLRQEATAREQEIAAEVDELAGRWLIARRRLDLLQPAVAQAQALRQRAEQARRRELLTPFQARLLQADALEVEAAERAAVQDLEQSEAALLAWQN